jgi:excisionase family DNA binding protein
MKQPALPNFFSIAEVAHALAISQKTVSRRIDDGVLKAHKIGHQWRVSEEDFRSYVALLRT